MSAVFDCRCIEKNALGQPHGFLCDTQGTLFYDLAKIIDHHQPLAFLLENVKNLERHDGGRTFTTIMHVLETELDYSVSRRVVNSSPWVPQKCERVFMVGFRERTAFDFDELAIPSGRPSMHRRCGTDCRFRATSSGSCCRAAPLRVRMPVRCRRSVAWNNARRRQLRGTGSAFLDLPSFENNMICWR